MVNSKNKGSGFEREATKVLTEKVKRSAWRKIPMSGAIGTRIGIPMLSSDLIGILETFAKEFKVECKVGYNNSKDKEVKQLTIKKEWIDKIIEEAHKTYSIPMLFCKFDNVRSGTKYFVIFDVDTFAEILNEITDLQNDLADLAEEIEVLKNGESVGKDKKSIQDAV